MHGWKSCSARPVSIHQICLRAADRALAHQVDTFLHTNLLIGTTAPSCGNVVTYSVQSPAPAWAGCLFEATGLPMNNYPLQYVKLLSVIGSLLRWLGDVFCCMRKAQEAVFFFLIFTLSLFYLSAIVANLHTLLSFLSFFKSKNPKTLKGGCTLGVS